MMMTTTYLTATSISWHNVIETESSTQLRDTRTKWFQELCCWASRWYSDLDGNFGVLVGQFECVAEHFEIFLEGERRPRQFLLVNVDVFVQLRRMINEDQLPIVLQSRRHHQWSNAHKSDKKTRKKCQRGTIFSSFWTAKNDNYYKQIVYPVHQCDFHFDLLFSFS